MTHRYIQFGGWRANCRALTLTSVGQEVKVERKVMEVLEQLAAAAPNVVTREELLQTVWPNVVVSENALHRVMALLRKSLGDRAKHPRYIESVPRVGYRLLLKPSIEYDSGASRSIPVSERTSSVPSSGGISILLTHPQETAGANSLSLVATQTSRYLNWSHGALRVHRNADRAKIDFRVELTKPANLSSTRMLWDIYSGGGGELIDSGFSKTTSESVGSDSIADEVAESIGQAVRQQRLHLLDGANDIDHLNYWDLIILAEHYRSMSPEHLATRERMLRRAITMYPREPAAHAVYGDFLSWKLVNGLAENGSNTKKAALAQNSRALEWGDQSPYVLAKCGTSYSRIGEHEKGCELGLRAYKLAPSNYNRDLLATSFTYAGKPDHAIDLYQFIERSMPDGRIFQYGRLVVPLIQAGRFEEADKYSELANTHFPRDHFCWLLRANLLSQLGRAPEANKALQQARELMPSIELDQVIRGIARTYCRTPEHNKRMTYGLEKLTGLTE